MVSAINPGPNDMAQPRVPALARNICCNTNITVAEDMFPNDRNTRRDGANADGFKESARSTAYSIERPPGCTAHSSISVSDAPSRISSALPRSDS